MPSESGTVASNPSSDISSDTRKGDAEGGAATARVHDPRTTDIVRRLRSVEGHVRGIERMVAEGVYCMDVMNQILAVQRALKKVGGRVLERHLETCVTTAIRSEDHSERERVIEEIMDVFAATGKA